MYLNLNFRLAGALLDYNPEIKKLMYEFAVNDANENVLRETGLKLTVETQEIEYRNEFSAAQKLCELLMVSLWSTKLLHIFLHSSELISISERDGGSFRAKIKGSINACLQYMRCQRDSIHRHLL